MPIAAARLMVIGVSLATFLNSLVAPRIAMLKTFGVPVDSTSGSCFTVRPHEIVGLFKVPG